MISRVRGVLVHKEIDRAAITTAGGVTYDLQIPARVYESLPALGQDLELHTALITRDDALELYGFQGELERQLFLRLNSASGVGPRLALTMLGSMSATQLIEAIRGRDLGRLQTLNGVGKKKAERIALELADKLEDMAAAAVAAEPESKQVEAAVSALAALGYSRVEAESAVRKVLRDSDQTRFELESLVREALAGMS